MAKRKGKTHANPARGAAVPVPASGKPVEGGAEAAQTGLDAVVAKDDGGASDGEAASGQGVAGAAGGPGDGAGSPADQAGSSTPAADDAAGTDKAAEASAAGGVADAAETDNGAVHAGLASLTVPPLAPGDQERLQAHIVGLGALAGPSFRPLVTVDNAKALGASVLQEPHQAIDELNALQAEAPQLTAEQLLALGSLFAPSSVLSGVVLSLPFIVLPTMGAMQDGTEAEFATFYDALPEPEAWSKEAHGLIVAHPGLPADALWLHMTARDLLPKHAESFGDLPRWEQRAYGVLIALYEAAWKQVAGALAERTEELRAEAERGAPLRRVPLSDTIFERHGHISELIDGLKLNR